MNSEQACKNIFQTKKIDVILNNLQVHRSFKENPFSKYMLTFFQPATFSINNTIKTEAQEQK